MNFPDEHCAVTVLFCFQLWRFLHCRLVVSYLVQDRFTLHFWLRVNQLLPWDWDFQHVRHIEALGLT